MQQFLDYHIFTIGQYSLYIHNLVSVTFFLFFFYLLIYITKRIIYKSNSLEDAKKFSVNKLARYLLSVLALLYSLHLLGFNISVLLAGSAALLVGLGFGLQNLFSDFISGIILLLDGTLKVGDVVEVNDKIYKVQEISFRTTTVIGRDENYVILPNSHLTGNTVINWTYSTLASRFKIEVGVDYSSDLELVMALLKEATIEHKLVLKEPVSFVRFEEYADSSLNFAVYFFSDEIFRIESIKSDIRIEIFKKFKDNGVAIPFPQRVIHYAKNGDV